MLDLLKNYSLTDIAIFVVMLAFAIKGVVDFYDWAKNAASGYILRNREIKKFLNK